MAELKQTHCISWRCQICSTNLHVGDRYRHRQVARFMIWLGGIVNYCLQGHKQVFRLGLHGVAKPRKFIKLASCKLQSSDNSLTFQDCKTVAQRSPIGVCAARPFWLTNCEVLSQWHPEWNWRRHVESQALWQYTESTSTALSNIL